MRAALTILALVVAGWAIWVLEGARAGIEITRFPDGPTPITRYSDGSDGPVVVVAHGFAGSQQMMQGYSLVLAQAGYTVFAFDFEGHGRHALPMSGDVNSIDGTTRLLIEQSKSVIQTVRRGDEPVALLGHSMATDILVRTAEEVSGIGPIVLLSAFSLAIDEEHPADLLLITGAWEPGLREFALDAARMVDPEAGYGETVASDEVTRMARLAPATEHVSILHSRSGRAAALDWINRAYDRNAVPPVPQTGWALLGLVAAITVLAYPLAALLPKRAGQETEPLGPRDFAAVTLAPMIVAPLLAAPIDTGFLPVLVADYLALHLALYGVVQVGLLWWLGKRLSVPALPVVIGLTFYGIVIFGLALDRYGASFWPIGQRLWIIAALTIGAVPFMIGDAWIAHGARLWQRVLARIAFLVSLGVAVALDFEGLFFLLMIAPVILLFWLTFGLMGRAVTTRDGPASTGLALGLVLAWALGVSFPLFQA
jgi:hypothetical protein